MFRFALFSTVPWIAGLIIAAHAERLLAYVATPAFYIGSIGVFLTTSGLAYGSIKQYSIYERFLACFDLTEDARQAAIREALGRHSSFHQHLRAFTIVFAICAFFAISGFRWWSELEPFSSALGTLLPRFEALSLYGWYDESIATHGLLIVLVFSVFISLPLGTGGSIIIRLPFFLWQASKHKPRLPPGLIKMHFAPATSFYAKISVLWLLGVVLIAYFFGMNKDWISISVVAIFFALGAVNFVLPQVVYARVVSASEDLFLGHLSERILRGNVERGADEKAEGLSDQFFRNISGMESLVPLLKHDHWVYPLHQTYIVVGAYLLSLLSWDRLSSIISNPF